MNALFNPRHLWTGHRPGICTALFYLENDVWVEVEKKVLAVRDWLMSLIMSLSIGFLSGLFVGNSGAIPTVMLADVNRLPPEARMFANPCLHVLVVRDQLRNDLPCIIQPSHELPLGIVERQKDR